jgi:hypothetical protein
MLDPEPQPDAGVKDGPIDRPPGRLRSSGHWAPAPSNKRSVPRPAGTEVVFNLLEHADRAELKHTDEPKMKIKPPTAR